MEAFVDRSGLNTDQRLQRMEDIEDIRRLRAMYHIFNNGREFGNILGLFAEGATFKLEGLVEYNGLDQIKIGLDLTGKNITLINQFCAMHVIDLKGDVASGVADMNGYYASQGVSIVVSARYHDEYVRTSKGWRFSGMYAKAFFTVPLKEGWAGEKRMYIQFDGDGLRADS